MTDDSFPREELDRASEDLRELLRIDTSNPPGAERPAMEWVAKRCREFGLEPEFSGEHEERPNLTARWNADPSRRSGRPLVLSCHLDVVPADPEQWTHPPFSGHDDGAAIWGRGAIDMKGFAVMGLAALNRLRRENFQPNRDIIFAAVADEEAGTRLGSRWLVDHRPDLLGDDPEYVINEVGGFTVHRKGRRFYPIQVAEKGVAWLRLTARGRAGHSSIPAGASAVDRLAASVRAIAGARLPWHPSPEARQFLAGFAEPEGAIARRIAPLMAHPTYGPNFLKMAVPDPSRRASLEAVLRNTANPTRLGTENNVNVLPEKAVAEIDGRLAPGQTATDLIEELGRVIPARIRPHLEWEVIHEAPATTFPTDTDLFRAMRESIQRADPGSHVVPSIIPGFTDSQNYARLGAKCYGFYPLRLPEDLDFQSLFHGVDERIPIDGFHWGIETLTDLLRRFLG